MTDFRLRAAWIDEDNHGVIRIAEWWHNFRAANVMFSPPMRARCLKPWNARYVECVQESWIEFESEEDLTVFLLRWS